jgi:DNA topoisomerase-3
MASLKESMERGDDPPVGRTAKQITGFKGRSGRSFRAKLKISPREEEDAVGKWKVDFDEEWATRPPKEQEEARASDDGDAAEATSTDAIASSA